MVPIDARLTISTILPDPKKQEQMHPLNEHLKKGETKKAIEVLGPADESVTLTTLFMPLEATSRQSTMPRRCWVKTSTTKPTLALKKAEDGWVSESQASWNTWRHCRSRKIGGCRRKNRRNRRMRRSRKIGGCAKAGK